MALPLNGLAFLPSLRPNGLDIALVQHHDQGPDAAASECWKQGVLVSIMAHMMSLDEQNR